MSRIHELLTELCPDGVEYKTLGEAGMFIRGNGLQKKHLVDEGVGAIHYGQLYTHYGVWAAETKSFVSPSVAEQLKKADCGDLVIATTSENDEDVCKAVAWLGSDQIAVSGDAHIYKHSLVPKFAAYFFQSSLFHSQKHRYITGTKVKRVSAEAMGKFRVPVPPVEIQQEIVTILDIFAELEAELEAELAARQKQYHYFRDSLLLFEESQEVEWVDFGNVAEIVRGASPRPIRAFITDSNDGVPWIKIGDIDPNGKYIERTAQKITHEGTEKSRRVYPGDFVLSNSMSFGRPYISNIEGCIHDGWLSISGFETTFNADFLYHLLRSAPIQNQFQMKAGAGGAVSNLNADIVRSIKVPVVQMSVQQKIAGVLDKFELLVNDLNIGLPAEKRARRKQYEYYRDQLLTFKEAS